MKYLKGIPLRALTRKPGRQNKIQAGMVVMASNIYPIGPNHLFSFVIADGPYKGFKCVMIGCAHLNGGNWEVSTRAP